MGVFAFSLHILCFFPLLSSSLLQLSSLSLLPLIVISTFCLVLAPDFYSHCRAWKTMPRHGRQLERRVSLLLSSPPVHPGSTLREMTLDRYANSMATAVANVTTVPQNFWYQFAFV